MKPIAITVSRFRGWNREHRVALNAPITSIVAENARGKSSLLNAIEWCLYGAVVTKKGSGIDERQDWEIRTRVNKDDVTPTVVTLELDTAAGPTFVTRQRSATAKQREADQLTIQEPSGAVLDGDSANSWLIESGIPDWETYRRAHCFHQEAARQRVVSTTERSAILAALLGLDDDLALRNTIESNHPSKLFAEIDKTLEGLNDEAHRSLDAPRRRLSELEDQATTLGIDAKQLSESKANALRSQLITHAQTLAKRLGLDHDFPSETDAEAARVWAPSWPAAARSSSPALAALDEHRRKAAKLGQEITNFDQVSGAWQEAETRLRQERQTAGDEAQRETDVTTTIEKLAEANSALTQNNARAQLLVDAKTAIEASRGSDACPVCETQVPGLEERLQTAINSLRSDEFTALQQAQQKARADVDVATAARDALQALVAAEKLARLKVEEHRVSLRAVLPSDELDTVHDVLAEAKKQRELIASKITGLEALASDRDQSLQDHQAHWAKLDLIEKWLIATEKAETSIDLSASPEWSELNAALDELAGFGSDLMFLGSLARELQAERSKARAAEVNKALGKYYSLITQDETVIQVDVHATAQRITYDLVDASGRPAVPILNQAAINSLSLAVLFGQSEAQASSDSWELVTLDDPVQSLDAAKQTGLAGAIEELSNHCSVLVAAVPSQFTDRLENYVSKKRHVVTLGPWSQADGASIEKEVDQ